MVFWRRTHPRLAAVALGVVAAMALWAGVEAVFALLNDWRGPLPKYTFVERNEGLLVDHPRLGFALQPGVTVCAEKDGLAGHVFTATYTVDAQGRRVTPQANAGTRPEFALFFGGSFTFGEGVEDSETLPARFAAEANQYAAYNYGCKAYGPQQMWLQVTAADFAADVTQERGVACYVFIDDHLARLAGSMRVATTWGTRLPYVTLESSGLTHGGSFEEARPWRQFFYRAARHLPSVEYFQMDWPPPDAAPTLRLLAEVCAATRAALEARFDQVRFYVLFYPGSRLAPCVMPFLAAAGVEYRDFSGLFLKGDAGCFLADGHPSPEGHRRLAAALAESFAATGNE